MIKNFFLSAAAVLLALVFIEGALRLQKERVNYDRKYFFGNNVLGPSYANCYPTPPRDGFNIQLNSQDSCVYMRNKYDLPVPFLVELAQQAPFCIDYDIEGRQKGFFPDRQNKLFIVGDSFAFGEGVPAKGTLAFFLSERLPAYNACTFARPGAGIEQIVRQVKYAVENNASPRILYFLNLNDPLHANSLTQAKKRINDFQNIHAERLEKTDFSNRFWRRLRLVRLIRRAWILSREKRMTIDYYQQLYFGRVNAAQIDETFALISNMHDAVSDADGRFALVIWPLIHKDLWGRYPFLSIHESIKQRCSEMGISCIDGLNAFQKYYSMKPFRVHPLDYHPNARANRIMADYLIDQNKLTKVLSGR